MIKNKTMKGRFITLSTLSILFLFLAAGLVAREKTEMIGKYKWYTEQNSLEEVTAIAKKENKPILAVFSATWCGPCQRVKKSVFKADEFKKVADKAVLLYIEQTTKEGAAYNKKYGIRGFPTFKILSANGTMLDTGHPKRTVDGFVDWIKDVKGGNNFYELSKKIEKNPKDREALLKITDKMDYGSSKKKIDFLKRAIDVNPDFNDALSQQAYEKLAGLMARNIPYKEGKKQSEYLANNRKQFEKIVDAYYPDRFKHELKGNDGLSTIMRWFVKDKAYNRAVSVFDDFYKRKEGKVDLAEDASVTSTAVTAYLGAGQSDAAREWVDKTIAFTKGNEELKKKQGFVYYYSSILSAFVEHLGKTNSLKAAEEYGMTLYDEVKRLGEKRLSEYLMVDYAKKYGIATKAALAEIDGQLKKYKGMRLVNSVSNKAAILAKLGKKDEARKVLLNLYNNAEFFKTLKKKEVPQAHNSIAWTMVELKIVDQKTLEIAKKAAAADDSNAVLDTLACVYAQLGNYKDAVATELKAAEKTPDGEQKEEFLARIEEWKGKIKSD